MSTSYEIWLSTPTGTRIAVLDKLISFQYQRIVNKTGTLKLVLPYGAYSDRLFVDDAIFEVWRSVDGGAPYLEGETVFFQHYSSKKLANNGQKTVEIIALDPLEILRHRIIQYNSGTTYTNKSGYADNICKAFVRENCGSLAVDTTRNMEPWLLTQEDLSRAAVTSKVATRRPILDVLQEVASDSFTKGTYLAFDIVSLNPAVGVQLQFRTYTGTRGVDKRWLNGSLPTMLDPENGNLVEVEQAVDNRDMDNAVYAGGQGEEENRVIRSSISPDAASTPWSRHEVFVDARNTSDPSSVQAEADNERWSRRTKSTFAARFVPTPGIQYGKHFKYGDYLPTSWDSKQIDMRVDSVGIKVQNMEETLDIILRSDS